MRAVVSARGRVTIPKAIRDELGLRPGMVIEFRVEQGALIGKTASEGDPFERWVGKGRLYRGLTASQYLRLVRG